MHDDNRAAHIAAVAWVHEDDPARVISAAQKAQALKDGGASASSVRPYSLAAVLAGAEQQGRERVAWKGLSQEEQLRFVNEILDYGMGFVAPLHGVVVSIENTLRERNGTPAPASQPVGEAVAELFREAIAWGRAYGAVLADPLWSEMRDKVAGDFADRLAQAAPSVAQAGLSDAEIMDIARQHFREGHKPEAEAAFLACVRAILARSGQPAQEGK
ncbi:hypothetical protein CURE108131_20820 [Cupriavidus respiraculi]|uniref:Uncharacterized protein n=1 Tax=Cupriavidus respiraculi TaxID=195930 RepID=A0ABN7YIF8_9BURK|nr:hypothetical protein [Cupriavidus respiraculi]CAG9173222.1 hypothetical protein LMG21510_02190 [Cupriavidus respiraculi]